MKKVTLIALFGLLATWFVFAVPEPRVGSGAAAAGGISGENGNLTNATSWVSMTFRGVFNLPPNTNTALVVHMTNYANQCYTTNDSFTVTFQGTPADGARGEFAVWNTDDEDKTLTWPASWSESTGAGITSINLVSNSVTRILWRVQSGSNYVAVIQKDAYQLGLLNPSVGQVLKVHCVSCGPGGSLVFTNSSDLNAGANTLYNDLGDSGGDGVVAMAGNRQAFTTTLDGGVSLTSTNSDADVAADTWFQEWAYRDNGDANAIFWKATHNAGASTAGSLSSTAFNINVASTMPNTLTAGDTSVPNVNVSSNALFTTADLAAASQVTNFVADYTFGARTINMAAAVWIVHATNHPAINTWKSWSAILRNNSGGALRVGGNVAFKRSGTNDVSIPNGARAKVVVEPDGTGGANDTNHLFQVILFQNP